MDHDEPDPIDPRLRLTRDAYLEIVRVLCGALPDPPDNTPEAIVRRDNAAIAQAAAMLPANADEAAIAATCVAARANAMDGLRHARKLETIDRLRADKCAAQANAMLREARQARSLLIRLQAVRERREKDAAATDRAAWSEHCTIGLMTGALTEAEPPPAPPSPEPAAVAEPAPDPAAEAEFYAINYPRRARLIRRLGRLPDNPDFGPPPPEVVRAVVTGTTPHLRALDAEDAAAPAFAG